MPELPEVETIRRGIEPHVVGRTIERVVVRDRRLRWPVARSFERQLARQRIRGGGRRARSAPIKNFLMDGRVVVGVGNIYAVEALFRAGIRPMRPAGRASRADFAKLVSATRAVLNDAIRAGGTTFRDFRDSNGEPGYF